MEPVGARSGSLSAASRRRVPNTGSAGRPKSADPRRQRSCGQERNAGCAPQSEPRLLCLANPIVGIIVPAFVLLHQESLDLTHSLLDKLAALRNHRYLNLDFAE